ncbi:MAG: cell division protein FtsZ [Bacteroidales bacterium]|nr:cell division protein FtsZ [Bacteroidales bacterium]
MEEVVNFSFDSPKGQSSYIKVIGVGGGGGNAVNHMFRQGIKGVDFIVCNTDMKALNASPVPNKLSLGNLGAGNKPEKARQAALDKADDIRDAISHNTQMLFITAGMGGGTGTGASPVVAEIAKSIDLENEENKKILVVAIVTLPFTFEGKRRIAQAQEGIKELSKHVDSIIVINNDKLRTFGNLGMSRAFAQADDILLTAAKSIAEIITNNAYINIDFQDVNTVMENSGTALMGAGSGSGENRAIDAITAATTSVLLNDNDIRGAKNVLLYFSYSAEHELTMDEQAEITDFILERTGEDADFIWGAGVDDELGDELKVILIATGFEKNVSAPEIPNRFELPKVEEPAAPKNEGPKTQPVSSDEPVLIVKDDPAPEVVPMPVGTVDERPSQAKPYEAPVLTVTPVSAPVQTPNPVNEKRVFTLDDVETAPVEKPAPKTAENVDVMVDDIRIVSPVVEAVETPVAVKVDPVPAVKFTPAPKPAPEPTPRREESVSAFENDNDVKTAAERIAYIHNLLRNNPTGAVVVQRMSAQTYTDTDLFQGPHSSSREASPYTLRSDGSMSKNIFFDAPTD